jgi:exodeoxyribonuclease VII large subunit
MSWDLFSAAEADRHAAEAEAASRGGSRRGAGSPSARNEALARAVAGGSSRGAMGLDDRPEGWPVSEVNALARELIEGAIPPLWVTGEVANFTRARSGHCYFTLRDDAAQLKCVMWRDEARRLPTTPAEGMGVRALGRLTVYEARGEFQLVVSVLEAKGEGLWKLAFDRLRSKLAAEGLLDPARKRPIPRFPACVGVVTSGEGAALRDIISVIRRRAPWTRIVLSSCRVQGEGAALEIAAAIERIARAGCADLLIVGRGGGSVEDLWAFNEEPVARAIAAASVPVISAVGHETDFTIADLVADLRAPTPSAAAETAVPDGATLRRHLDGLGRRLSGATTLRVEDGRRSLARYADMIGSCSARGLRTRRERVRSLAAHLNALSPLAALERGFAVPLGEQGRVLRRTTDFQPGMPFELRIADGTVACRVRPANDEDV